MTHTLIINGEEQCFEYAALSARGALYLGLASYKCSIQRFSAQRQNARDLPWIMGEALERGELLLLYYAGHGAPYGLAPYEDLRIHYDDLAYVIATRESPTLIVNGGCYAYALAEALERAGADPKKVGVIASCGTDGFSYGHIHNEVIFSWDRSETYTPEKRMIFGPKKPEDGETYDEVDGDTITCHIGAIDGKFDQEPEADRARRWGTLELDRFFFTGSPL